MFIVISFMLLGVIVGLLIRKEKTKLINNIISVLIGLLLLLLGWEIGSNEEIISNFAFIGGRAIAIAVAATLGSIIAAKLLWHFIKDKGE